MDMMDYQQLIKLEKLFREKAVLRQLVQLYGLYEEKILVRPDSTSAHCGGSSLLEVSHQGSCDDLALIADRLATKEDELLFNSIASHCFPLLSNTFDVWLDNFTDITDVLIITSDNMLDWLSTNGNYESWKGHPSFGLKGTYKKNSYYIPVHSIGDRHEEELLILKTDKLGTLRQYVPLPVKIETHVEKTIFHVAPLDDTGHMGHFNIHESMEYVPTSGFLGYFVKIPVDGNVLWEVMK